MISIAAALVLGASLDVSLQTEKRELTLKTAIDHPMEYYLSLPVGWHKGGTYPVVLIIESANREFQANAMEFVKASPSLPYVLVAPVVLTGGGSNIRPVPTYHYSGKTWKLIDTKGPWKFDVDGIRSILAEVRALYGGEKQVFATGWEAGCHTLWALLFEHSDWFRAVAMVCPNYLGRWLLPPHQAENTQVPIRILAGKNDDAWAPGRPLFDQTENALVEAGKRGFKNIAKEIVPGEGHNCLAHAVIRYFETVRTQ